MTPPRVQPRPPGGLGRLALEAPTLLYRAGLGALLGHRFLMLTHRGGRTGLRRRTVVEVVQFDPAREESVVVAGWGRRTQWLHNVEAGGALQVTTAGRSYRPACRTLGIEEAAAVLAGYERRNRLVAPVVRRVLSRLLGWRYDGTPAAQRRAMGQLPMIGFRPLDPHASEA